MSVTQTLANFAVAPVFGPNALAMMRLSLMDWAACGIAGQDEPVSKLLRQMVVAESGAQDAALFGGGRAPMRGAALVNGATSHALDYDDTHFGHIGHPSVAVIPAALAVAEMTGADGDAFLDACLVGVELSIRVGMWLGRDHYQTGFHQTGTAGTFGATAAVGRLLGLSAGQMAQALGLASTRASGLKSQFGTMGKPYNAGIAASSGVEVAQLAAAGFISNPAGLETAQGFGATHAGQGDETALTGLGADWRFEGVSHKFHACCHGLHATLEALLALRDQIDPSLIEAIEITTHPRWLSVCNIADPVTGLEAKFSYRQVAAMVLQGIDTGAMASFTDAICHSAEVLALREKVDVVADEAVLETASKVVLRAGNSVIEGTFDLNAPMSLAVRSAKLTAKTEALIGKTRAAKLKRLTHGTPDIRGIADMIMG